MKILLCTNSFENVTNGPAKFANLILEINSLYPEHEIRILTEDIQKTIPYVYQVEVKVPGYLRLVSQILRMFIYDKATRRIRQEFDYDILVYNNSFIGLWSALTAKRPTVGMINDDNNLTASWRGFSSATKWAKRMLFRKLEQLSVRFHRVIITNSDFLTQAVIGKYGQAPKIKRLYKAVDLSNVVFQPKREFKQPIRVLFVKADYVRGGLLVLLNALSLLNAYTFVVTVVGPENRFRQSIEALFESKTNVTLRWAGVQHPKEVSSFMQENDFFCVPAEQEALGVANIEALAAGLPVVSTYVGGIPEVLDHGNNGWIVPPSDSESLSNAIKECITNTAVRRQRSEKGHLFVRKFAKEEMFENFIEILRNATSHHA